MQRSANTEGHERNFYPFQFVEGDHPPIWLCYLSVPEISPDNHSSVTLVDALNVTWLEWSTWINIDAAFDIVLDDPLHAIFDKKIADITG